MSSVDKYYIKLGPNDNTKCIVNGYMKLSQESSFANLNTHMPTELILITIDYVGNHFIFNRIKKNLDCKLRHRPSPESLEQRSIVPRGVFDEIYGNRLSITTIGDMHIIPHDYFDYLLENAQKYYNEKKSRKDYVKIMLQKNLPEPVAQAAAEALIDSLPNDDQETQKSDSEDMPALTPEDIAPPNDMSTEN